MSSNKKLNQKGFTIIEVLIVLAIAALIMLVVFLAVPALQRNSRNNARNNEAARISAAVTECLANRNGDKASCNSESELSVGTLQQLALPTTDFSDNASTDLNGGSTTVVAIGFQRKCSVNGSNDEAGSTREFAITYQAEPAVDRCISS